MGRWSDRGREHQPRDWMVPDAFPREPTELSGGGGVGVETGSAERRYRTPWARGPRAPLRRNQGVPAPLETPLYLHHAELARVRARHRDPWAVVAWALAAAGVGALVAHLLQGP